VAARCSAKTDRIREGRNLQPQFYAVVAIRKVVSLRRVPWATQTFAEGSAAAKRLKNTGLGHATTMPQERLASESCWLHQRESGPEVNQILGGVITSLTYGLVPSWCGAQTIRDCSKPSGISNPPKCCCFLNFSGDKYGNSLFCGAENLPGAQRTLNHICGHLQHRRLLTALPPRSWGRPVATGGGGHSRLVPPKFLLCLPNFVVPRYLFIKT